MTLVALGLGSNLGDRANIVRSALFALQQRVGRVLSASPLYETEPWGVIEQPRFLNAACLVETVLCPFQLLAQVKRIEVDLGRVPTRRYGPRAIDIDILLYGEVNLATAVLTVPHAGMLSRASVLVPLADIAPSMVHPLTGRPIAKHLQETRVDGLVAAYPPGLP